jgi:CubicO group peptidase (beta-lactamase class C family)
VATDVLARAVEVICGEPFDRVLRQRIFEPLQLADTGFFVPEPQQHRLAGLYQGLSLQEPMVPGLTRAEQLLEPPAHLRPAPLLSGGGGLVSSLPDMVKLLRSLMPGGPTLLKPATLELMARNRLPESCFIQFPGFPPQVGRGHGLAGGVILAPTRLDHPQAAGELYWGGMAGTMWWVSAAHNFAAVVMTQRWLGFGHPYGLELKREVYNAVLGTTRST